MIKEIIFIMIIVQIPLWLLAIWWIAKHFRRSNLKSIPSLIKFKLPLVVLALNVIILSAMRAILVDPEVVIVDGYNGYALIIREQLLDWDYVIDEAYRGPEYIWEWQRKYRIEYSLLIAIINIYTSLDIILIGRIISLGSFLSSIYLLNRILEQTSYFENQWRKNAVLSLFVTNVTIITNLIRFETDIFFLALLLVVIVLYQQFLKRTGFRKLWTLMLIILVCIILIFTREIGFIIIVSMIIHQLIVGSNKARILILGISAIIIFAIIYLNLLVEIFFFLIWSAGVYDFASELILRGNIFVIFEYAIIKFLAPNLFWKTLEAVFIAFGIPFLVAMIGLSKGMRNSIQRRKIARNLLSFYFAIYVLSYLFLKVGRGLDRFFIPILFIPYFVTPLGIEHLSSFIKSKGFSESLEEMLQTKILAVLVVIQIMIFGFRLILSLLEVGINY